MEGFSAWLAARRYSSAKGSPRKEAAAHLLGKPMFFSPLRCGRSGIAAASFSAAGGEEGGPFVRDEGVIAREEQLLRGQKL